jgi:hypothetical protein
MDGADNAADDRKTRSKMNEKYTRKPFEAKKSMLKAILKPKSERK